MDAVARQAGVARGSVYNHFSSKEELFLAVMRRGTAEFVERSLRHDADSKPPLERLLGRRSFPARGHGDGLGGDVSYRSDSGGAVSEVDRTLAADHLLSVLMGGFFSRKLLGAPKHPADKSVENYVDRAITSLLTRGRPRRHPSPGER